MAKKKHSKVKKYWEKTKTIAKATQKEVQSIGKVASKVGAGLSASGGVIQDSFRPSSTSKEHREYWNTPTPPRWNCEMCGRRLALPERDRKKIAICQRCLKGQKEGFYTPAGYKKKLGFGWGGF